jgi:hypothetical protein
LFTFQNSNAVYISTSRWGVCQFLNLIICNLIYLINVILMFNMWIRLGKFKSLVDHPKSVNYNSQLPSRPLNQHSQQLLPRSDKIGVYLFYSPNHSGKLG